MKNAVSKFGKKAPVMPRTQPPSVWAFSGLAVAFASEERQPITALVPHSGKTWLEAALLFNCLCHTCLGRKKANVKGF
jgi:hypothetical protein